MKKGVMFLNIIFLLILIIIPATSAKECGADVACDCGDTLTSSHTMWYDLVNCSENGLIIGADDITLDCDGHLIGGDSSGYGEYGISLDEKTSTIIKWCNIGGFSGGIDLYYSHYNSVVHNILSNNSDDGITIQYSNQNIISNNNISSNDYSGIWLLFSHQNILLNNSISHNNYCGIWMDYSNHTTLSNNILFNNKDGIIFWDSNQTTISNNLFLNNGYGIFISDSSQTIISNNNISDNKLEGIYIGDSVKTTIFNNSISNNDGIELGRSNQTTVFNNLLFNNSVGISLWRNCTKSIISNNNISNSKYYGIKLSFSSNNNTISNNDVFDNNHGIYLEYSSINNKIEYNNIYNNSNYNIYNYQIENIKVEYNWWGTADEKEIARKILDCNDYSNRGCVDFIPYLTKPWSEDTCYDGIKNGDETDIDCGGSCPSCENGKSCLQKADCLSGYCNPSKICSIPNCGPEIFPELFVYGTQKNQNLYNALSNISKEFIKNNVNISFELLSAIMATLEKEVGGNDFLPVEEGGDYGMGPGCTYKIDGLCRSTPYDGGVDYKGRGYIQITHKYNYQEHCGSECVGISAPELDVCGCKNQWHCTVTDESVCPQVKALRPTYASKIFISFYNKTYYGSKNLITLSNEKNYWWVGKKINGGDTYASDFNITAHSYFSLFNISKIKTENLISCFYIIKLPGDVNGNGKVDIFDLAKVGLCYGCSSAQTCWTNCKQADVREDNKIDIFDLATVGLNYGKTC